MPGPDLLVAEPCRDGGEVKKHIIADHGRCSPIVGERAILVAARMPAQCGELRAGDPLSVRLPIEWEDVRPNNLDEPDQRVWVSGR
jgi:hypothetical protein